ncbi:recombinase family protein [Bacillus thuringiensis]|uniref:recombinase family protein n=1 Tax=Bacillus thuringiensis TaxID=1428 RepID=UPI0009BCB35B|nr:recombinase family protein [Bacillus thuringiensis]MEC3594160.1 recombinase family protein [Bacillus thuringiensis]MED1834860.1 recombinase family protein [Bacillus thuringiensis]MED2210929.1 recombinase family protein [Bacillus thuringiensis]MED2669645.1 recombinase family protein [Bacillus thuringiensis]MED2694607.1 recombinase family protein [Bacillus thuringiensis]
MINPQILEKTKNDVFQNTVISSAVQIKRVAIYARVSTTEQAEEGYSIDEQERLLSDWCTNNGYIIHQVYADRGISGKSIKKRPALKQMLSDARNQLFDIVLVWKTNRLARNILDLLKIVEVFNQNYISFRSFTENHETETSSGKFQFHMMAAIAEFERNTISENVKMGMLARAREGKWNGGQVLGYDLEEMSSHGNKRKHTKLVINEKEAQTVRRIFELYISGNGYKAIANCINKEGHRGKKGRPFSINTIKTILENPVYIGVIRYNVRRNWTDKRRGDINPSPIFQKGEHDAIISQVNWEKAQQILKQRSHKPNRVHGGTFPFTGILRCPKCGAGMVVSRTVNTLKNGTKKTIEYYACGAWKNKGTSVCNSNTIRADKAEAYIFERLQQLATNEQLIQDIVDTVNGKRSNNDEPIKHEFATLTKELEQLKHKKEKAMEMFEDDLITKVELQQRLNKINELIDQVELRLQPIKLQMQSLKTHRINKTLIKEVMSNFHKAFKQSITQEQQKHLVVLLIKKITINKNREIDSIQIQFNNAVLSYFTAKGVAKSLSDDLATPFLIEFKI